MSNAPVRNGASFFQWLFALSIFAWLALATCLPFAINIVPAFSPETAVGLAVVIPVFVAVCTGVFWSAFSPLAIVTCCVLVAPLVVSSVVNGADVLTVMALAIVPLYVLTGAAMARLPERLLIRVFGALSIFTLMTLLAATFIEGQTSFLFGRMQEWQRLNGGVHPNYFGLTALVGCLFALGLREPWRVIMIGVLFWLAALAQSRMSLFCILICATAVALQWRKAVTVLLRRRLELVPFVAVACLGLVGAAAFVGFRTLAHISSLGGRELSDMGGRAQIYTRGLQLLASHPLLGYGYRAQYTQDLFGDGLYSHNMWLAALIETGAVGVCVFFAVYSLATLQALKAAATSAAAKFCVVLFAVYFAYGIAEGRYVNTGNPLSILFLVCIGYMAGLPIPRRRRVPARAVDPAPLLEARVAE